MSVPLEPRPNQDEVECRILRTVFSVRAYPDSTVHHRERPDFFLQKGKTNVGVEITSTYRSPSSARLLNDPGYWDDLMNRGRYRNRADRDVLLPITGNDGVKYMLQHVEDIDERQNLLAEAINEKTAKNYDLSEFDSSYLIVLDGLNQQFLREEYETLSILNNNTRHALIDGAFDEVYLVVRLNPGIGWAYVPCQQLMLWDYWSRFVWACSQLDPSVQLSRKATCEMFGSFLAHLSPKFRMADVDGYPAICYRQQALLTFHGFPNFMIIDLSAAKRVVYRQPRLVMTSVDLAKLVEVAYTARVLGPPATRSPHQLWESRGGHPGGKHGA